jgi:hypothetical protein
MLALTQRLRKAVASGFASLAPLPGAPWPDLPTHGWSVDNAGRPVPLAAPMDCGYPSNAARSDS